jgi:hypothetical protein
VWHYVSLAFVERPLRKHREWRGAVTPYLEGADGGGAKADGRGGAAKRRLNLGCFDSAGSGSAPKK